MPQRHRAPDGTIHVFPDDFTDADISAAFDSMEQVSGAPKGAPGATYGSQVAGAAKGIAMGGAKALWPPNIIRGVVELGRDVLETGGQRTIAGIKRLPSEAMRLAREGSAEELGEAAGTMVASAYAPRMIPPTVRATGRVVTKVPKAMIATGKGLERVGKASRRISPFGVAEAVFRADPHGLAVAAAPYAIKGTGTMLRKAGEYLRPREAVSSAAPRIGRSAGLSIGEEAGVQSLDDLLEALHGPDQPLKGNGSFSTSAAAESSAIPLTRTPRIGPPRAGPTAWDATAGPTLTANERALLQALQQSEVAAVPRRLLPSFSGHGYGSLETAQGRALLSKYLQDPSRLDALGGRLQR